MNSTPITALTHTAGASRFFRIVQNPFAFRLFLIRQLPAAWFSGVRLESADEKQCTVSVPYKWFTKNPFRSTYFACLSMAAEMSTGILSMAHIYKRDPAVSMLVTGSEGKFFKKATGRTTFRCAEGARLRDAVGTAVRTGEGQTVRVRSEGRNAAGELVAAFEFEWSFKVKRVASS